MLALGALLACKRGGSSAANDAGTSPPASAPRTAPPASVNLPSGLQAPTSFADLAARADPAVVAVRTVIMQGGRSGSRRVVGEGQGSAFVYDPEGLILTNSHVIANAAQIRLTFANQRELDATVVGRDPPTDVAVLRVEEKGLPYVPLGDSDDTRVGDWVMAIGNPFGLSHTVSAGIISAKGRTRDDVKGLGDGSGYYNFIQTDASINPGNSGGPLLDLGGRVVGINTAVRARANNIGFAVPINMVKELLPRLIRDGKIVRSGVGIRVVGVTPEHQKRLGLADRSGALVSGVNPGGPAEKAGLASDDVILGFDGAPIPGPEKLRWLASLAGVGKAVALRVARGSRRFDVKVTLDALPETPSDVAEELDPFDVR
jgi:serine protease Do